PAAAGITAAAATTTATTSASARIGRRDADRGTGDGREAAERERPAIARPHIPGLVQLRRELQQRDVGPESECARCRVRYDPAELQLIPGFLECEHDLQARIVREAILGERVSRRDLHATLWLPENHRLADGRENRRGRRERAV